MSSNTSSDGACSNLDSLTTATRTALDPTAGLRSCEHFLLVCGQPVLLPLLLLFFLLLLLLLLPFLLIHLPLVVPLWLHDQGCIGTT